MGMRFCYLTLGFAVILSAKVNGFVPGNKSALSKNRPRFSKVSSSLHGVHNDANGDTTKSNAVSTRRKILSSCLISATAVGISPFVGSSDGLKIESAQAAVVDETDKFGDNWWTKDFESSTSPSSKPVETRSMTIPQSQTAPSDEVTIAIAKKDLKLKEGLGLELGEIEFRTNLRVIIKSVTPGSAAERFGIKKDWVVVGIDGKSTERTNAEGVAIMVYRAARKEGSEDDVVLFTFRDPAVFRSKLNAMSAGDGSASSVTTQVSPAGDTTQRNSNGSVRAGYTETEQVDQRLTVTQLVPPKLCKRGAEVDDLLEISYIGTVVETGAVFDGSAVTINNKGIPGRGNDVSLFFVLGKQPFGQFPPGWDVGLYGICVGERRRLTIPPVLAYGSTGLPRRGIPPNSTLQYDITLVSINGLATPQ